MKRINFYSIFFAIVIVGYCYAEPTIEVKLPGAEPVVYGGVDREKADEIIEKYIKGGELVNGIIPVNYETIDSKEFKEDQKCPNK